MDKTSFHVQKVNCFVVVSLLLTMPLSCPNNISLFHQGPLIASPPIPHSPHYPPPPQVFHPPSLRYDSSHVPSSIMMSSDPIRNIGPMLPQTTMS